MRQARRLGAAAALLAAVLLPACGDGGPVAAADPALRSDTEVVAASMSVTISGRSIVPANVTCEWVASVTGGTPPYSYSWSQTWGTGTAYGDTYFGKSHRSFQLYATVTDANGQTAVGSKSVTVAASSYCAI